MSTANNRQVAGDHYRSGLQPWDVYRELFGLSFYMCNAAKYLVRWRKKNGLEDLQKSRHYLQKLMECAKDGWANPIILDRDGEIAKRLIARMVQENDIPATEYAITDLIFRWHSVEQLDQALMLLESLIIESGGHLG